MTVQDTSPFADQFRQSPALHLHFETRHERPKVFKITRELVEQAHARSGLGPAIRATLGHGLGDLAPLRTAKGLVTSIDIVTDARFPLRDLTTAAPELAWIHITGAGIEPLLPLDWLPRSVTLTNNSGVHVQKTGEFAAMALLMLNARMPQILANQRDARWEQVFTPSIAGQSVVVIGLGDMGGAAARQAKRLGMRVLGVRRSGRPHRHADRVFPLAQLTQALGEADFIFVAAPLTPQSRHLIDAAALAAAKPGAALVNVGRAGVVDYAALCDALESGALSGAILDVFDEEPLPSSSPLWRTRNLIVMPHCSSDDAEAYMPGTLDLVFRNARRLLECKPLINRVDRRRGY